MTLSIAAALLIALALLVGAFVFAWWAARGLRGNPLADFHRAQRVKEPAMLAATLADDAEAVRREAEANAARTSLAAFDAALASLSEVFGVAQDVTRFRGVGAGFALWVLDEERGLVLRSARGVLSLHGRQGDARAEWLTTAEEAADTAARWFAEGT